MQTLKEKLKEDLKKALMSRDIVKRSLIQVILGEVALEDGRGAVGFHLNDDGILAVLKKLKKNHEVTKTECEAAGREVPEDILKEIEILNTYLPAQMSKEDVEKIVDSLILEIGATSMKEMGSVMGAFNSKYAGQADGKIVSQIVKEKLNKNVQP